MTKASSDESLRWRVSPEAACSRDSLTAEGGFRPEPPAELDNLTAKGCDTPPIEQENKCERLQRLSDLGGNSSACISSFAHSSVCERIFRASVS